MRRRIVDAALDEFARVGFEGAQIERIAAAAGCNRALVYFYFGNKTGLFEAALSEAAEHREEQMAAQPSSLAEGLVYWFRQNVAEPRRIRLVMQEALAPALAGAPERRKGYHARQIEVVKAFQNAGLLRSDISPSRLLTLFLAITSFPAAFPKVASVSLGVDGEAGVVEEWSAFLTELASLLEPPRRGPP
jgi:AcrR family transcriptional regulator